MYTLFKVANFRMLLYIIHIFAFNLKFYNDFVFLHKYKKYFKRKVANYD